MKRNSKWVMLLGTVGVLLAISASAAYADKVAGVSFSVSKNSGSYIGFDVTISGKKNIDALKASPWAVAAVAAAAAMKAQSFYVSFQALGWINKAIPVVTAAALTAKIGSIMLSNLRYCTTQLVITAKNTRLAGNKKLFSPSIQWYVSYR